MKYVRAVAALLLLGFAGKLGGALGVIIAAVPAWFICPNLKELVNTPVGASKESLESRSTKISTFILYAVLLLVLIAAIIHMAN